GRSPASWESGGEEPRRSLGDRTTSFSGGTFWDILGHFRSGADAALNDILSWCDETRHLATPPVVSRLRPRGTSILVLTRLDMEPHPERNWLPRVRSQPIQV